LRYETEIFRSFPTFTIDEIGTCENHFVSYILQVHKELNMLKFFMVMIINESSKIEFLYDQL
jgi:hypothetical protein